MRHSKHGNKIDLIVDDATHERAVLLAREAEKDAIDFTSLSVQELVDCDTFADQGCTGGNPLLAFYFIHRFGLTSSAAYPYVGRQDSCKVDLVASPIATVQSWGILTPNHEDNMERVLRGIGPIAVGIDGADPAFMSYSGGIFESKVCGQMANHALLIVGYGREIDENGRTVRWPCSHRETFTCFLLSLCSTHILIGEILDCSKQVSLYIARRRTLSLRACSHV